MVSSVCCFTGHRNLPVDRLFELDQLIEQELQKLIHSGITNFLCGGARGFDLRAAFICNALKADYPQLTLHMVLPCKEQTRDWNLNDKRSYQSALTFSDSITLLSGEYFSGCMQKRNRFLVDNSSCCLCFLTKASGGTWYTVNYAKSMGMPIINLAEAINQKSPI